MGVFIPVMRAIKSAVDERGEIANADGHREARNEVGEICSLVLETHTQGSEKGDMSHKS